MAHGTEITAVHASVTYDGAKGVDWFVDEVTKTRRKGNADPDKL